MTTYFSFDEVSLKNEVKLIVIIFVCVCVCVILLKAKGTCSHLDFSNVSFSLWNLADLAKIRT